MSLLNAEEKFPVTIEDEVRRSYLDYAMSVIIGRALPDVRDGLKPVHRRCLFGMWEQSNFHNRPYKKSARIVGDVLGKYHPHGESSVYDSIVRMAQDFSMRYPLVDGQGNFGSVDGDNAAAMRYTEVRLTRLAAELIGDDIEKETVDWTPNYDGSLVEPTVFPAKFPNLLVNGSSGIAVGMATNIPPHNLGEVVDATIELIRKPDATVGQLMKKIQGPDFPTAAFIHGSTGIRDAYTTGRGIVQVRAKALIEKTARGDKESIVLTELPYQVNKAKLVERIAELVNDKKIDGISDLRDESDRDGIRVVVELKRGENAQVILNQLYSMTPMQSTFGIIFLAIVDNQPRVLPLVDLLRHFIDHRKTVVIRRTQFDLKKAEERAHLLRGLALALANIEKVIAIIRGSKDPKEAKERLVAEVSMTRAGLEKFIGEPLGDTTAPAGKKAGADVIRLDELQAQAILDMRLQRLTGLEREKIVAEFKEVLALIHRLREILGSEKLVLDIIVGELTEVKKQFGDERRTQIVAEASDINIEDLIVEEDMVITVSRGGYIKRSPLSLYRAQRRGGKGRIGATTKEEDVVEHLFVASTHAFILAFTNRGRLHWIKVYDLPSLGPATRGKAIVNLLNLEPNERVVALASTKDFPEDRFLVFATKQGLIKKTPLSAYSNVRSGGIIAINIESGDELLSVRITDGTRQIFIGTRFGQGIRFSEKDVRAMGRDTTGVYGVSLRKDDYVVEMDIVDENGHLLTVTEKGYGKRSEASEYRFQGRGGSGVINIKVTEKNGPVSGIKSVSDADQLLLITQSGMLIRIKVKDIRETGRAAQGVRLINLDEGDCVVAVAKLAEPEEIDDEGQPALLPEAAAPASGKTKKPETSFLGDEEDEEE
ncbi:MAG: DNA gyrase subunit A [Acidobacteria bacterium]|nr:DNA gyrase subunit A [Acidobacteriota bacterium]MCA1611186.1 DNA gyrase subunit A [Acidobacteriota bacterium]